MRLVWIPLLREAALHFLKPSVPEFWAPSGMRATTAVTLGTPGGAGGLAGAWSDLR